MTIMTLKFRTVAASMKVLVTKAADLEFEAIENILKENLPERYEWVLAQGANPTDPYTLLDTLVIDAIVLLEDYRGKATRVGISLYSDEREAYKVLAWTQKEKVLATRKALKIYRHWIFVGQEKYFPSRNEWVDILYSQIDEYNSNVGCKLIYL